MSAEISVDIDSINQPHWDALKQGKLVYQSCPCGHAWLPPSRHCPRCLGLDWKWEQASGQAAVVSWVVYHVAYHPEFKDKLPYNVAIVRLQEGPQMITNIVGNTDGLAVGAHVRLQIDLQREQPLATFCLA